MVAGLIEVTKPCAIAAAASSPADQRVSGSSESSGGVHARALISAFCTGVNVGARPGRGRSFNPAMPWLAKRRRHLRTVSSQMPRTAAIAAWLIPAAQARMILARSTSRYEILAAWARAVSTARSESDKVITNGEDMTMV